jgi:hypothetical protein
MKLLIPLSVALFLTALSTDKCSKKTTGPVTYKAKLETKALCMNYTLRLLEGSIDPSLIDASWKDESTGKSYTNVFGLANPCNFPATIEQGDEFYFVIDDTKQKECAVCMAYYPTPTKKLSIKVVPK